MNGLTALRVHRVANRRQVQQTTFSSSWATCTLLFPEFWTQRMPMASGCCVLCARTTVQRPFMKNKWTENNLRAWRMHAKWEQIRWFGQGKRVPINSHSLNGLITMFPPIIRCTKCSLRDAPAHAMGIFAVSVSSLMMLMLMHSMHCHVNEKSQLCRSCQMLVTGTTTLNTIYFVKTNWIKLHHALVWHAFH